MNDDNFGRWERILMRLAGLALLTIAIVKIVAAEMGIRIFH